MLGMMGQWAGHYFIFQASNVEPGSGGTLPGEMGVTQTYSNVAFRELEGIYWTIELWLAII